MKKLIIIVFTVLLYGCPPCDRVTIESGPFPDSVKAVVPYQNGESYKLKYSNGLVINFVAEREIEDGWDYGRGSYCPPDYHFEIDKTTLVADYPLFDIQFQMDNSDTSYIYCYGTIGQDYFYIPTDELQQNNIEKEDSMLIDSVYYKDVYRLHSGGSYTDSLYYNYDFGIIKLIMSDGETYTILQ